jgi:beta-galactosidase
LAASLNTGERLLFCLQAASSGTGSGSILVVKYDENGNPWSAYGGDFGDTPNDHGLPADRMAGTADRAPHPALTEAKHQQVPFGLYPGEPSVTSEYLFRHSDNELLHWMKWRWNSKPLASSEGLWICSPSDGS